MERGWREMPPNCPRCGSTNTKFCYYNNYSLTQPRYFCKGCRRYWTKGGSLRNVPVGGGCRKSRRGNKPSLRISSSATTSMPYPTSTPSSCCRSTISAFGHVIMNSHDGHSSSSSSSASTIDLAVVYANFLKPKTPHQHEESHGGAHLPNNNNHSNNYCDQLISPSLDQIPSISEANMDLALLHYHNHDKQQDQGLMQNHTLFTYADGNERIGKLEALLPPLPREEEVVIPWKKNINPDDHDHDHDHDQLVISSSNDLNVESNALQSTMQDPLEAGAQFSSLFNIEGCWSPLDFSGYNSDIQTPVDPTTATPTAGTVKHQQWP